MNKVDNQRCQETILNIQNKKDILQEIEDSCVQNSHCSNFGSTFLKLFFTF